MGDDAENAVPPPLPLPQPAAPPPPGSSPDTLGGPLSYASPGAHDKSQWITDDGPGGRWLVECLILLSAAGVVAGTIAGVLWLVVSW